MILLMLFFNFLDLKIDPHRLVRKELLITFLLSIVIMPSITYYFLSLGFEPSYRMGLLLVACSPSGVMGIILINYLTCKDYNLVFSNLLFSTFGSILFIPIILKLFLGQTVLIEMRPIMLQTAALIIIPFLATRFVNRFFPEKQLLLIKKIPKFVIPFLIFFYFDFNWKRRRSVKMESDAPEIICFRGGHLFAPCRSWLLCRKFNRQKRT
jgi:predicted Na+-dependent transporter